MDEKVESKNQSGGITAFNVNVGDNSQVAGCDANVIKVKERNKVARMRNTDGSGLHITQIYKITIRMSNV